MKKQLNNILKKAVALLSNLMCQVQKTDYVKYIKTNPYTRLIRLDKPAAILLLALPIWWSVVLAVDSFFTGIFYIILFGFGAFVMRSAGCIVNDIFDREFDKQVQRTKDRPIANGDITIKQALVILLCLLSIAFLIFLSFSAVVQQICFVLGMMIILYPFMKRFTYYAQVFLGFTYNAGIIIAWYTVSDNPSVIPILLYLITVLWTIAYDTVYSCQDIEHDLKLGLKSTSILFGDKVSEIVKKLYIIIILGFALIGIICGMHFIFYAVIGFAGYYIYLQLNELDLKDPKNCDEFFVANTGLGFIVLIAYTLGRILA